MPIKIKSLLSVLAFTLILFLLLLTTTTSRVTAGDDMDPPNPSDSVSGNGNRNDVDALVVKAESQGSFPVIVKLNLPFTPEGAHENAQSVANQRSKINQVQTELLSGLTGLNVNSVKQFRYIPYVAFHVDSAALEFLAKSPLVMDIQEDKLSSPTLDISIPIINADDAWAAGYSGAGQVVAILDTGVDSSHPFLSGKVVSEACYSTNDRRHGIYSLCPNDNEEQTGTGAGVNCDISIDGCDHGTHVAGIVGGNGSSFSGVAKDADVIAIQVFTEFTGSNCTNLGLSSPCILSYDTDQASAMERVYDLRTSFNIASANLSLSGGKYTGYCDSAIQKSAIDNLRSAGIATVIASGNGGYSDGIGSPACISTAVSVGATTTEPPPDLVASYSNSAYFLDLLAPGSSINSSVPGGGYQSWNGTSMATPHVTGAWAVYKSKYPSASVDEVENALKANGVSILDSRNGLTFPRIDLGFLGVDPPEIIVNPASFNESLVAGGTVTRTLTISNVGSLDLTWGIDEQLTSPSSFFGFESGSDVARVSSISAQTADMVLYDNGPLVNCAGCGSGGADESMVQNSSLNMDTYGLNHSVSSGFRIADDFTISDPVGWHISTITFYAYQTGGGIPSTITVINLRIWDGPPDNPGSGIVFGDSFTNRLASTNWSNIYRVLETTSGNTDRPIMSVTADINLSLASGTYWLDWQVDGSAASGPWAPPITINGQTTTGNALQYSPSDGIWNDVEDGVTLTQQGFPFIIEGSVGGVCIQAEDIPWLSLTPTGGTIPPVDSTPIGVIFNATGMFVGTYTGNLCINSNDPATPLVVVPLTMNVNESKVYIPLIIR